MNHERSPSKNQSLSNFEAEPKAEPKNKVKFANSRQIDQTKEQSSNIHQSTPLDQPLWFWSRHSSWSYFNRGLFWGGIISLTAVSSGIIGVALTKIDAVEQAIAQRINPGSLNNLQLKKPLPLASPMSVLLIGVKSDANEMIDFSGDLTGEIQTILLLKFDPDSNSTQAINIPLNSRVEIPGHGQGVVSDAYRIGGVKLLSETIAQLTGYGVDRHLRATPDVFRQLTTSGKITLASCDSRFKDCLDLSEQVLRQQTTLETIRQRLNIPSYLTSFQTAIAQVKPNLDTDLAVPEIISLANFVRDLEPDRLSVDLLPEYVPGKALGQPNQIAKFPPNNQRKNLANVPNVAPHPSHSWQDYPIAVQNTTDNPELGRQVVAYLRHRNFRNVYLVPHIPLELEQTKIVVGDRQLETAKHLKNILGFGNFKPESSLKPQELVLQLGEDALYLPTNYRSYN